MTDEPTPHHSAYRPTAFMVLWALSLSLDATYFFEGFTDVPRMAAIALTIVALWRPAAWMFAVLLLFSPIEWILQAPQTSNHGFVVAVGSLVALGTGAWRDRDDPCHRSLVRPLMTGLGALVYSAAILQKLNWEYLADPDASCAVAVWEQYVPIPDVLAVFFGPASLVLEGLLAVVLLVPRLHKAGLWLAFVFHGMLGINPVSPIFLFSLTMLSIFSLLLDDEAHEGVGRVARVASLFSLAALAARAADVYVLQLMIAWLAWAALQPAWVAHIRSTHVQPTAWSSRAMAGMAGLALLVILNCVPAYTGDRQFNSFDMYSNLRVDHTGSNHLFLPSLVSAPRPFAEPVVILSHEPEYPNPDVILGLEVPRLEFAKWLAQGTVDEVRYRAADGTEHTWRTGDPRPAGVTDQDLAWRRLRRTVDPPRCVDCVTCLMAERGRMAPDGD